MNNKLGVHIYLGAKHWRCWGTYCIC